MKQTNWVSVIVGTAFLIGLGYLTAYFTFSQEIRKACDTQGAFTVQHQLYKCTPTGQWVQ